MHRFLVPPDLIRGSDVTFPDPEWRHLSRVLRLRPGEEVVVFDGRGNRYLTLLHATGGQILSRLPSPSEPEIRLHLAQGLAKGDKMDFIIQKAVELGVHAVIPLASEHAVARVDPQDVKKQERWQRISEEACKQCGRDWVPLVDKVHNLGQLARDWENRPVCFFYEGAAIDPGAGLKEALKAMKDRSVSELLLVVGPEGGFSETEAQKAMQAGWKICSLGPRILRTETAALTAMSIAMYELADLG